MKVKKVNHLLGAASASPKANVPVVNDVLFVLTRMRAKENVKLVKLASSAETPDFRWGSESCPLFEPPLSLDHSTR